VTRTTECATLYETYRQKMLKLLRTPQQASQLKSFTLLLPYDFEATDVTGLSARKYRHTGLVESDAEMEYVLKLLSQNATHLRRFKYVYADITIMGQFY
jgi:hypothetical protein